MKLLYSKTYESWQDLLSEAAKEIDLDIERESHDLISLAQFYCNIKKRNAIDELLTTKFPTNVKPTENHKLLSQLPISTYWTTNYDTLIEDALKNNNMVILHILNHFFVLNGLEGDRIKIVQVGDKIQSEFTYTYKELKELTETMTTIRGQRRYIQGYIIVSR